jgi:hypothetical protein
MTREFVSASWSIRRAFWNWFAIFKYDNAKPDVIGKPRSDRILTRIPLFRKYPGIEIPTICAAEHVPRDESYILKRIFSRIQAALYAIFGPMEDGLPAIDVDPMEAIKTAYTAAHRRRFPGPIRPPELNGGADLGALAVASPYACYLKAEPTGGFCWDFSSLDGFQRHQGLRSPASRVEFRLDKSGGLRAERIDSEAGSVRCGDAGWELATKLALCGATTHLSLIRHFNGLHLACGAEMAIATRNVLPLDHPVRRLMWPHVFGTQYSNDIVTLDQMVRGGDFESVFSFTHAGMCRLFEATHGEFDLASIHPRLDASRRGIVGAGFGTPALDNRSALYDVIERHAIRYFGAYYESDDALAADAYFVAWLDTLDSRIPNGVRSVAGQGFTIAGAARLTATLIYLATVEHEIVGSGVWDYQLWTDVQPVRVSGNGSREPLDVYQRLVNANFNLNVHRTSLLTDFSSLALDPQGADAFVQFQADLVALQADLDREPPASWRMTPNRLKANINT